MPASCGRNVTCAAITNSMYLMRRAELVSEQPISPFTSARRA